MKTNTNRKLTRVYIETVDGTKTYTALLIMCCMIFICFPLTYVDKNCDRCNDPFTLIKTEKIYSCCRNEESGMFCKETDKYSCEKGNSYAIVTFKMLLMLFSIGNLIFSIKFHRLVKPAEEAYEPIEKSIICAEMV